MKEDTQYKLAAVGTGLLVVAAVLFVGWMIVSMVRYENRLDLARGQIYLETPDMPYWDVEAKARKMILIEDYKAAKGTQ